MNQSRRDFIRKSSAFGLSNFLPYNKNFFRINKKIRTAHIGVGGMGLNDLKAISSHKNVEVTALCDVDSKLLNQALKLFPKAKLFRDYRVLLDNLDSFIYKSDLIIANRLSKDLDHVMNKVYSRDIFKEN